MVSEIRNKINEKIIVLKKLIDNSLYDGDGKARLNDSELTELIIMSGYLANLQAGLGKRKKLSETESRNINEMLSRIEDIEKNL